MRSASASSGASSAYNKLTEKTANQSFLSSIDLYNSNNGNDIAAKIDDEFTVGSLSSVLLSFDHHNYVSEDEVSYSYSYSVEEEEESNGEARLGIAPYEGNAYTRDAAPLSISPVKNREDNDTLDIPGCSDWSFDISRMSLPIASDNNNNNAHGEIAQDAAKPGVNDRSPNSSDTSASNISALNQQVEWLALRLESLENAIRTNDDTLPSRNNIAFIAEEDESTVESLTNDIVLPGEVGNPDDGTVRRKKRSLFMRFCFFGGCK